MPTFRYHIMMVFVFYFKRMWNPPYNAGVVTIVVVISSRSLDRKLVIREENLNMQIKSIAPERK
jgi:predicted permease